MGEETTLRQLNHTLILLALFIYSDNVSRNDSAGSLESNNIHPLPGKDNGVQDIKLSVSITKGQKSDSWGFASPSKYN